MNKLILLLRLPTPPSVNCLYATNKVTHQRFKSVAYKNWIKLAEDYLKIQKKYHFLGRVKLTLVFGRFSDKRKRDIENYTKATFDFLTSTHIIEDDSLIERYSVEWNNEISDKQFIVMIERFDKERSLKDVFGDVVLPQKI